MRTLAHQAVTEGIDLKYVERMRQALYAAADRIEALEAGDGLPSDLLALLRDPTVVVTRDHEVRLADGRTLHEHLEEWRNAPSNTASAG
jgi:hypothetical protein